MGTKRKATMLRLTEEDTAIINRLRTYYGVVSQNEVVRMALRAALRELPPTQAPDKDSLFLPMAGSQGTPRSEG